MAIDLTELPQIDALPSDEAHARYAELRPGRLAHGPSGFLAFLDYRDVHALLCDRSLKPTGLEMLEFAGVTEGPLRALFYDLMFNHEDEDHQRLRRLVSSAFSPRAIEALRESVRATVRDLLDKVVGRGQGDLTEDLAKPLAIATLCDLLGVPPEDVPQFQQWAAGMGLAFGLLTPETIPIVEEATVGVSAYAEVLIERRRATPTGDLVSELVRAEEQGDRLSASELVATVANLLFAGYDTTYRQITLALLCLARNEDVWARLAHETSLAGFFVEEALRLEPIAHETVRLVLTDTSVNGIELSAGMLVEPVVAAANRDPTVFTEPDRLDLDRRGPRVLSFGQGIHSCLGAALARLELSEAVGGVAQRLAGLDDRHRSRRAHVVPTDGTLPGPGRPACARTALKLSSLLQCQLKADTLTVTPGKGRATRAGSHFRRSVVPGPAVPHCRGRCGARARPGSGAERAGRRLLLRGGQYGRHGRRHFVGDVGVGPRTPYGIRGVPRLSAAGRGGRSPAYTGPRRCSSPHRRWSSCRGRPSR